MNKDILKLLQDRYFLDSEKTWEQLAERVGAIYPDITEDIKKMNFVPGSPFLMNANTKGERKGTLSSCFPMNIEDSIDNIMESMKESAEVTRMGGGVGYDFSVLRGSGEVVKSNGKNSGGVMSFIGIYDSVLDGIKQGGARRGAGMSLLSIYHPQILDFINAKKDLGKYNRSNFSVKIPNKFYKILKKDPDRVFKTINVVDKKEKPLVEDDITYTYKMLWEKIIESAWSFAEPGIINEDYIIDRVTVNHIDNKALCNPCSEFVTTVPYSPCNLGSIDVSKFVVDGEIDFVALNELVRKATRFLDNAIDVNDFPLKKIKDVALSHRPIGLGLMGFAHLLYKLNIPYNSKEAKELADKLMKNITMVSMDESIEIAKSEKGKFEWYDFNVFVNSNKRLWETEDDIRIQNKLKRFGCRNSSQTSIAPTGSISTIARTSSGIEPVFGLVYTRKIETGNKTYEEIFVIDPVFEKFIEEKYPDNKEEIYKYISSNSGSCQGCKFLTKEEQAIFVVAGDIDAVGHVDILASFAKYVSLSVSKTINLPKEATEEDISKVYLDAHDKGIIGVTVYRDGCREGILVHSTSDEIVDRKDAPVRPQELDCDMFLVKVKDSYIAVLVGKLRGMLYEMFVGETDDKLREILKEHKLGRVVKIKKNHYRLMHNDDTLIDNLGKFGSTVQRSLARFISMSLRHGVPLKFIVEQLNKSDDFMAFDKSVSRVLKRYIKNGEVYESEVCPECESKLIYFDGCVKCSNCLWTKCG